MICPSCDAELRTVVRNGVEIDICPRCRGVWLDRGELDKLLRQVPAGSDESDEDDDGADQDDDRRRDGRPNSPAPPPRKKGFWGNMFDFD